MQDTKYNGWTNYATWRVHLEIFDNQYNAETFNCSQSAYDLTNDLKEYVENHIEETTEPGIGRDYALAFVSDVNFYEIATHLVRDYAEEVTE
jgi:hypothetical protein